MRTAPFPIVRNGETTSDVLAVEEPLEIRVGDKAVAVTMRTPGDDFELAAGFLFTEGIIRSAEELDGIRHWGSPNVVRVALRDGVRVDWTRLQRNFYTSSSCGICGKASIDALRVAAAPVEPLAIDPAVAASFTERLRERQQTFEATGGLHAAGLFTADGAIVDVREDVGRHNAVDKVIGARFLATATPLRESILVVSGRASFELVQKAVVASIPMLVAVGAPSSLAVDTAHEFGLTLIGFAREGRWNRY